MSESTTTATPTIAPAGELRVIGTYDGVTGRYFHLNSGSSVKLSNFTNAYICLAQKCISARNANACEHCTTAAIYHHAFPDAADTEKADVEKC